MRLYDDLAAWWPLLSAPEDYADEADVYRGLLSPARTILELGSGGGNNASHLKRHFAMTLADRSAGMLAVSRRLNPECEHVQGDMRTVRLGRTFDAVFVHDAVAYMTCERDLAAAMTTAAAHLRAGGIALFVPDCVRESFRPGTGHGGHDAEDGRGLRYLEWTHDPDPSDTRYTVDFAFLLRDASGAVSVERDRHELGIFAKADWSRILAAAGFDAEYRAIPISDETLHAFIARKR